VGRLRLSIHAPGRGPARAGRAALLAVVVLAVLAAVFLVGGGWYFSGQIRAEALTPERGPQKLPLDIEGSQPGTITLRAARAQDSALNKPLLDAVVWPTGDAQVVGAAGGVGGSQAVRPVTAVRGVPPQPGQPARLDSDYYLGDPRQALGLDYRNVGYTSPLGQFSSWFVPADAGSSAEPAAGHVWAVMVHGKGATRQETLRLLSVVHDAGFAALVITYRNDEGQPADPSGQYRYGATEWRDLEGAVQYALGQGATAVIPVGISMGGGIVASFLQHSPLASRAVGVVLDAPMLNLGSAVDYGATQRRLPVVALPIPAPLTDSAQWLAGRRFGVNWPEVDYLRDPAWVRTRTLVLHGDEDTLVPVADSQRLAAVRPELVTLLRFPVAGHVESWNADRSRYQQAVRGFLATVAR